jgi:hypothetical protein
VTALRRRVAPLLLVAAAVAGCGSSVRPAASPSASPRSSVAEPSLTPVPGGKPTPAATLPTTTETEFGRIWDGIPDSFPRLQGAAPADQPGPASAIYAVVVRDLETAIADNEQKLVNQGWTVDVGSPLEDGTVVFEATRAPKGCKLEERFTPMSGSLIITVLYGAACPFS